MCILFCNTRFHHYSSLRGSPSTWSSPQVLCCAISLMCMSRQTVTNVTGTVFLLSSAPRWTSSEFFTSSLASFIDWSKPLNTLGVPFSAHSLGEEPVDFSTYPDSSPFVVRCAEKVFLSNLLVSVRRGGAREVRLGFFCGDVPVASSRTPITLSLSYHESRAEGYSVNSQTSTVSSSFVVQCTENGSLFSLQACQTVQRNPIPPMKHTAR